MTKNKSTQSDTSEQAEAELRDLIGGSALGAASSIPLGLVADSLGGVGFFPIEGVVRYIAGNSDTLGELGYTLRRQRAGKSTGVAWNYVKGELIGTAVGPILLILFHTVGVSWGINPYGTWGVIMAAAFAHSDNLGGMIADLSRRFHEEGGYRGFYSFICSPYMQGNALFILLSVVLSTYIRINGFEPRANFLAGIEGTLMGFSDSLGAGLYAQLVHRLKRRRASK
ncbi:MAG TPA: hypothetical protein VF209_02660 [Patescibacteria group bacterium]